MSPSAEHPAGLPGPAGERRLDFRGAPGDITAFSDGVHVKELFGVLRRHVRLLLAVLLAGVALAFYLTPVPGSLYTTGAAIQVVNARRALAIGIEDMGSDRLGRFVDPVQSHIEMLRGRLIVGRVVDRQGLRLASATEQFPTSRLQNASVDSAAAVDTLHLSFDPSGVTVRSLAGEVNADYGEPVELGGVRFTLSEPPEVEEALLVIGSRDLAISRVTAGIAAAPRVNTDVIDVYYTARDPASAQRIVNALVEEHRLRSVEAAQERSHLRSVFLAEQLRNTEARLAEAQRALSRFRGSREIYSSRDRLTAEQQSLADLQMKIEELHAERRLYQALMSDLRAPVDSERSRLRALVSAPGIASNPVVSQLNNQLLRYESARDSLVIGPLGRTSEHPDVERLNQLIAAAQSTIVEAANTHVRLLDERIRAFEGFRARSAAELRILPQAEAEEMRLTQQVQSIQRISDELRTELQKAEMAEAVEAGQVEVLYYAPLPAGPSGTNHRKRNMMIAGALALMLGIGGAFTREMLNTSIRRPFEVQTLLRLQELAVIPRIESPNRKRSRNRQLASGNGSAHRSTAPKARRETGGAVSESEASEAFRALRTNLSFAALSPSTKSLAITSASPQEGKSTTAINLACVFAQQGRRILLIDADLRRPRLHEVLQVPQSPGLSCVLLQSCSLGAAIQPTSVRGLFLLPSGTPPTNPSELLGSEGMREVLSECTQRYDLVIVDTPPLLAASDAAILAAEVASVLFVVRAGRTQRTAAQHALTQLTTVGAHVAGAVLNDPDVQVAHYGGYHFNYGYYAAQGS